VAAHLDAGPTGQPGKCQAARRLSPPLSVKTTSLMGPPMVLPQPTASGGGALSCRVSRGVLTL